MTIVSVFLFLAVLGIAASSASVLARRWTFYRPLTDGSGGRLVALDGFRGVLALGVFVHHSLYNYRYAQTGAWGAPYPFLVEFLGKGSVAFFFMTSGFLFWSKAIDGKIALSTLLRSRVRRLMPMYWVAAAAVVVIALLSAGRLQVRPLQLSAQLLVWASGGLLGGAPIDGVDTIPINAGVTWSLQYEWCFYLLLPALAVLARPGRLLALGLGFAGLCLVWHRSGGGIVIPWNCAQFLPGMAAAHLVRRERLRAVLRSRAAALVAVPLFVAALIVLELRYSRLLVLLATSGLFLVIASGNDLFGALRSRGATFLGHVSYSVYLIHGIVLFLLVCGLRALGVLQGLSLPAFLACCLAVTPLMVGLAGITYQRIEAPFFAVARRSSAPVEGRGRDGTGGGHPWASGC